MGCLNARLKQILDNLNTCLQGMCQAEIIKAELIGAILYTGPMFMKYNVVTRGRALSGDQPEFAKEQFGKACLSNRSLTTIHAINSAILKLSNLQKPTIVYQGVTEGV